jgi:hypothetical protein
MPTRPNIQVDPFFGLGGQPAGTDGAVEVEGCAAFGTEGVGAVVKRWLVVFVCGICGRVAHASWR